MNTPIIEVRIWGNRVGAVAPDAKLGCYVFAYDSAWQKKGIELAPLHIPLSNRNNRFSFSHLPEASYKKLPAFLADILPDDFGNALINAWMASKGIDKRSITTLDRMAYMGNRGMGALEFKPARGAKTESAAPLEMKHLVEATRRVIQGDLSGDAGAKVALSNIISVGTSAGGARAKAVIAWNPLTNEIRSGQFDAAEGFEHWLLKFDGVGADSELGTGADYGRIEYAYYLMAKSAGVDISPCRLLEENGRAHFMTKRFDRDIVDGKTVKHHLQSLCAMDHLDFKQRETHAYAQLFMVVDKLALGDEAVSQVFRRMALNVLAKNCDDHTKNFSFILKEGGQWQLAKAYDVTHAYNPKGEWTYQHLMSVNGKFSGITEADLLADADRFGVRRARDLLADARSAIDSWPEFATLAGLSAKTADAVAKDFEGKTKSTSSALADSDQDHLSM